MNELLPPWPLYLGFVAGSSVLAITPGPAVLYIVTRSLVQGRRTGLASVAGVALGNLGNAIAAGSDPDNFVFTTDPALFSFLLNKGMSAVLQYNEAASDDGSLSVLLGKKGRTYVNVEAQHDHLDEQLRLLQAVTDWSRQAP